MYASGCHCKEKVRFGRRVMTARTISTMLLAGAVTFAGVVAAQEKKIKRSDLPPAVEKTVARESVGATIRGFSEEKENGQTFYEAEMTVNGHSKDVAGRSYEVGERHGHFFPFRAD